jgi:hypothetical protein
MNHVRYRCLAKVSCYTKTQARAPACSVQRALLFQQSISTRYLSFISMHATDHWLKFLSIQTHKGGPARIAAARIEDSIEGNIVVHV